MVFFDCKYSVNRVIASPDFHQDKLREAISEIAESLMLLAMTIQTFHNRSAKMQTVFHEKFVIDENGECTAVIIGAKQYARILDLLEAAQIVKIIRQGEKEYHHGKLKPILSLSDIDK